MSALDYPVALRLAGEPILLVGAGAVALGRLRQLLEVGARVRVVSPEAAEEIHELARAGRIELELRRYRAGDCAGAHFVFAATNDPGVTPAVVAEARARGLLVNAADIPELCDFTIPSFGRRGPVTIAVSTAGHAPALARALRLRAMAAIGPEYGALARLIGRLRRREAPSPGRKRRLQALVDSPAAELTAAGDLRAVGQLVRSLWRASHDAPRSPSSPLEMHP